MKCPKCKNSMRVIDTTYAERITGHSCWCCGYWVDIEREPLKYANEGAADKPSKGTVKQRVEENYQKIKAMRNKGMSFVEIILELGVVGGHPFHVSKVYKALYAKDVEVINASLGAGI